MRLLSLCALASVLLVLPSQSIAQPPPPFSITITSPVQNIFGVPPSILSPVVVQGTSGAPNSTVTVKLINAAGTVIATQNVGTNGVGSWAANFGTIPNGTYFSTATLLTGQSDITVFVVDDPGTGGGNNC